MFTHDNTTDKRALSDKTPIDDLKECEDLLREIEIFSYNHNDKWLTGHREVKSCKKVGPIADQVAKVLPYAVRFERTSGGEYV